MSNPTPMKSAMNGGLTIEDVRIIQADAEKEQMRRLRDAKEDGLFEPTPTPGGDFRDPSREPDQPQPGTGQSFEKHTITNKGR